MDKAKKFFKSFSDQNQIKDLLNVVWIIGQYISKL